MSAFNESTVEGAGLEWLKASGWQLRSGAAIARGEAAAARKDHSRVILPRRLRDVLARLNLTLPDEALDDAFRRLSRSDGADLVVGHRATQRRMADGVTVEHHDSDDNIRGAQARTIDLNNPSAIGGLAVNQLSAVKNKRSQRPDLVLFVNSPPIAALELKRAAAEKAMIGCALQRLQTCQANLPTMFAPNAPRASTDRTAAGVDTIIGDDRPGKGS
jgi:type I restriction enzyme R subunit